MNTVCVRIANRGAIQTVDTSEQAAPQIGHMAFFVNIALLGAIPFKIKTYALPTDPGFAFCVGQFQHAGIMRAYQ